ncbi:MAG: hypothetical protein ACREKE_07720 [bacterium]
MGSTAAPGVDALKKQGVDGVQNSPNWTAAVVPLGPRFRAGHNHGGVGLVEQDLSAGVEAEVAAGVIEP